MLTRFVDFLYAVPFWEAVIFLLLTVITFYRKRLSSNDIYRQQMQSQKKHQASQFSAIDLDQSRVFLKKYNRLLQNMVFLPYKPEFRPAHVAVTGARHTTSLEKLTTELTVHLLGYLETFEIVNISMTSPSMRESFTSDVIWEQLWHTTFGRHWRHEAIVAIRKGREIFWDPVEKFGSPQTGWFHFYLTFEVCWLDWLLAGYSTDERCLVAVGGAIYDVTAFLLDHPGSPETLTEGAGCDATDTFADIGHSLFAEAMKRKMCIWDAAGHYTLKHLREGGIYTQDGSPQAPHFRIPGPSRLRSCMRMLQRSISDLAMEALLPHHSAQVKRVAAQAAQRIALTRAIAEAPPLFGPPKSPVQGLQGYYPCPRGDHVGHAKAFYDPLAGEWNVWWSCCGQSQAFLLDQFQPGTKSR